MSSQHDELGRNNERVDALKTLADYCVLRLVGVLQHDNLRFNELSRALGNPSPVTLTDRLRKLERNGLIIRSAEVMDRQSVTYCLSELGLELLPIVTEINKFTKKVQQTTTSVTNQ